MFCPTQPTTPGWRGPGRRPEDRSDSVAPEDRMRCCGRGLEFLAYTRLVEVPSRIQCLIPPTLFSKNMLQSAHAQIPCSIRLCTERRPA